MTTDPRQGERSVIGKQTETLTSKSRENDESYLGWLVRKTRTKVWQDSADPALLGSALERGIVGVTTNPLLTNLAISKNRQAWTREIDAVLRQQLAPEDQAEALMRIPIMSAAKKLLPEFERSHGRMGYVCAQVNPARASDREGMSKMAHRFASWAPNIAVKLPATCAGMDVLEQCIAEGITITSTVSFTVPQVLEIGERSRKGAQQAGQRGTSPGRCFAVVMMGRLDDYLLEVGRDNLRDVDKSDIQWAGLAVVKRVIRLFAERNYEAVLLLAAQRGSYHVTEVAGSDLVVSLSPTIQRDLEESSLAHEECVDEDVPSDVVERLRRIPEFLRAYEPEGMRPEEFISYGATQRTLSQFVDAGWKLLEARR